MKASYTCRPWSVFAVVALLLSGLVAWVPATSAQDNLIPTGAPVDIHSGTCEDFLTEPTYEGGEITATTTDDVWDEEQLQAGILIDEAAGVSGVDLNGDQTLQPTEVVVLNGETAPVGKAEATFDEAVDTSQPIVVALHAGADTYETVLSCGALNTGRNLDGGGTLTVLQPQGDAQVFGYAVVAEDGQSLTAYLFQPNVDAATSATPVDAASAVPEGYPVDVHPGTCEDWTTEPTFDIGIMQKTNVAAEGEQEPGDTSAEVPAEAQSLGDVYKVAGDTDLGAQDLFDDGEPYIVGVHESADNYETLIACGQIMQIMDGDQVIVILQPVGGSDQTGFVRMGQEAGEAKGFLWNCQPLPEGSPEATPVLPTPEPSPTPTVSPTPEGSAVIVETEVVTSTEVVPAATATALAQQTPTPTPR